MTQTIQNIDPRLKKIADHYGFDAQAEKSIEEMAELIVEIKHHDNYMSAIEELADVKIMIDQLVYLVRKDQENAEYFDYESNFKIERQLKRIAEEEQA